jgi:hypothetical protein
MGEKAVRRRVQQRIANRTGLVSHTIVYLVVIGILSAVWGQVSPLIINAVGNDPMWLSQLLQQLNVPLIVAMGWGIGLANHFIDFLSKTTGRIEARRRAIFKNMQRIYGDNWEQDASERQYKNVRRSVMKRFDDRVGFFHSFITFVMTIMMLTAIWTSAMPALQLMAETEAPDIIPLFNLPLPLIIALVWGVGLAINGIGVLFSPLIGSETDEQAIERELARERERDVSIGKRKNAMDDAKLKNEDLAVSTPPRIRLTEEGELTESFAQELDEQEQRRTNR